MRRPPPASADLPSAPWRSPCSRLRRAGPARLSRIKDIADIEGVRENQLVGYGLVVGLNGTGDTLNNAPFTKQSLQAMLERLGVNTRGANMRTANVAAVMVTANLPAFATQGTRLDVTVSALGDAKSLQGGTLLVTPLLGADGEVYAVGQGSVAIAGFQAEGDAATVTRGVPTAGRISDGALIEREIEFKLSAQQTLRLALRNPDLTTARRIAAAINDFLGSRHRRADRSLDRAASPIPPKFHGNMVELLTEIEQLASSPTRRASIVIDERSGIIVMGNDVRVSTVAVAQGNLTVTIAEQPQVSQPAPLADAARPSSCRAPTSRSTPGDGNKLALVREGVTLQRAGRRAQRARHQPARPDLHPAGHQGLGRAAGRNRGDVMAAPLAALAAASRPSSRPASAATSPATPPARSAPRFSPRGRPSSRRARPRRISSPCSSSTPSTGCSQSDATEGPLGDNGMGGGVYRSMLAKEYAGTIAKSGGVGIADQVYREILKMQESDHGRS